MSPQDWAGRDIPSPSSHSSTSDVTSEDSDKSVELRREGPTGVRTAEGSVGLALLQNRRRQNMLGAVEVSGNQMGATGDQVEASGSHVEDSASQVEGHGSQVEVDAPSADDASNISVLYDSAGRAVFMATSRQDVLTAPASSAVNINASQVRVPPPPPPLPLPPTGIDCTPTFPPEYASDALLISSGQDVHTELTLSRAVGGADWCSQCSTHELAVSSYHDGGA